MCDQTGEVISVWNDAHAITRQFLSGRPLQSAVAEIHEELHTLGLSSAQTHLAGMKQPLFTLDTQLQGSGAIYAQVNTAMALAWSWLFPGPL